MSEPRFSIRIKIGAYEVEVSGARQEVLQVLENLAPVVEAVSKAFGELGETLPQPATTVATSAPPITASIGEGAPSVTAPKSCADAVMQLLQSKWGRAKPRTLGEMMDALRSSALHHPASTIGKTLQRLTQRGKLRRWKTKDGYVYVVA